MRITRGELVSGAAEVLDALPGPADEILSMCAMNDAGVEGGVEWLIILTFPNGGSTALAKLLLTAEGTVPLNVRVEGQWLVPEMSASLGRWDPSLVLDYQAVRRQWMNAVRQNLPQSPPGDRPWLVIEKSPPNMCRYRELVAMLAGMKTHIVVMTRDPFATCASWSRRYPPANIEKQWGWPDGRRPANEDEYFRALAQIWIARATRLRDAAGDAICRIRYEDFADDPATSIKLLARDIPRLGTANPAAAVLVKEGPPRPIHNTNRTTLESLTERRRSNIASVLAQHSALVAELGYPVTV